MGSTSHFTRYTFVYYIYSEQFGELGRIASVYAIFPRAGSVSEAVTERYDNGRVLGVVKEFCYVFIGSCCMVVQLVLVIEMESDEECETSYKDKGGKYMEQPAQIVLPRLD